MDILIKINDVSAYSGGFIQINASVHGAGGEGPYNCETLANYGDTANAINAAIKDNAVACMASYSHTVASGDKKVLFGAAI